MYIDITTILAVICVIEFIIILWLAVGKAAGINYEVEIDLMVDNIDEVLQNNKPLGERVTAALSGLGPDIANFCYHNDEFLMALQDEYGEPVAADLVRDRVRQLVPNYVTIVSANVKRQFEGKRDKLTAIVSLHAHIIEEG